MKQLIFCFLLLNSHAFSVSEENQQKMEDLSQMMGVSKEKVEQDLAKALEFLDGNKNYMDMNFHFKFPSEILDKYDRKILLFRKAQILTDNLDSLHELVKLNESFYYGLNNHLFKDDKTNQMEQITQILGLLSSLIKNITETQNSSRNLTLIAGDLAYIDELQKIQAEFENFKSILTNNEMISEESKSMKFTSVSLKFIEDEEHPGDSFIRLIPRDRNDPWAIPYVYDSESERRTTSPAEKSSRKRNFLVFDVPFYKFNLEDFRSLMKYIFPNYGPAYRLSQFDLQLSYEQFTDFLYTLEDLALLHNQTGKLHLK